MNTKEDQSSVSVSADSSNNAEVNIRRLSTLEEYEECVKLQKEIWGNDYKDCVPGSILKISQKIGGLVAGAFEGDRLLGFVYGLTGVFDGELAHWSHMLAVRKEARGKGLAKLLKLYQREFLLSMGVRIAFWTYDPLVARNANLNINGLGAGITEYVKDMYVDAGSDLHRGLGMDRFIVAWHLGDEMVAQIVSGKNLPRPDRYISSPVVNTAVDKDGSVFLVDSDLPYYPMLRIEIPLDIESIQASFFDLGSRWRTNTRRAFLRYMEGGYKVDAFYIEQHSRRCYYCLTRSRENN